MQKYPLNKDLDLHQVQMSAVPPCNHQRPVAGSGAPPWQCSRCNEAGSACPRSDVVRETWTVETHRQHFESSCLAGGLFWVHHHPVLYLWWHKTSDSVDSSGPQPQAPLWLFPPPPGGEVAVKSAMWRRWLWWSEQQIWAPLLFPSRKKAERWTLSLLFIKAGPWDQLLCMFKMLQNTRF